MPIKTVKGNILESKEYILAHGVNCRGKFNKGLVVQIAEKFPEAKKKYLEKFSKEGWRLGEVQFVNSGSIIIANCATQYDYGGPGVPLDYDALKTCMEKVRYFARNKAIAIPKIGAGLAKGNWEKIYSILEEVFKESDVVLYLL